MEEERNQYQGLDGEKKEEVEVKDRGLFDRLMGRKNEEVKKEECKQQEEVLVTGMEKVTVDDYDVGRKNEEVRKEEFLVTGMEKVPVNDYMAKEDVKEKEEEKKESLMAKLHRSHSSSSSSSDEEEEVIDENGEIIKRKKKKGLKEKIKEKLHCGEKKECEAEQEIKKPVPTTYTTVPTTYPVVVDEQTTMAPATPYPYGDHDTAVVVEKVENTAELETTPPAQEEEKKGFLDKIKEKLPGAKKTTDDASPPAPTGEEMIGQDGKEKKGILGKIMEKLPGYNKGPGEEEKGGEQKTTGAYN